MVDRNQLLESRISRSQLDDQVKSKWKKLNPFSAPNKVKVSRSQKSQPHSTSTQSSSFHHDSSTPKNGFDHSYHGSSNIQRVESLTSHLSRSQIILLFFLLWLFGAILSLDRLTTYSYQTIATNSFNHHSDLALVDVVRSILAAIVGPPFSLICDIWGRKWGLFLGLILYSTGHTIMATSLNVSHYIAGVICYEAGANALVISQWIVISDISSTRNRLLAFNLPQTPFIIFGFISTSVYTSILPNWRWGIGMFAILAPAALLPLILVLEFNERRAIKLGWVPTKGALFGPEKSKSAPKTEFDPEFARPRPFDPSNPIGSIPPLSYTSNCHSPSPHLADSSTAKPDSTSRSTSFLIALKQASIRVDLVGLFLLTISLCALLVPLTLASSSQGWSDYRIITPLVIGTLLMPIFLIWEIKHASHPIVPSALLKNRSFLAGGLVLTLFWISYNIMSDYLPTYLYVVKGTSSTAQQNVSVLYSFTNATISIPIALSVRYFRRLKYFTLFGTVLLTLGFGLVLNINQESTVLFDVVSSQIVIGLGGAFAIATIQSNVQVVVPHALVARSISSLNIFTSIGSALGAAIVGSMWTNLVPNKLEQYLSTENQSEISEIFSQPLTWILDNPIGTDIRTQVIQSYYETMNLMMIVSISICSITIFLTCFMENPKLDDRISTACGCQELGSCACKSLVVLDHDNPYSQRGNVFKKLLPRSKVPSSTA